MTTQTTTGQPRQVQTFTREIEGKTFEISTGLLAPNALAACTLRYGDTVLLVTVCDGDARPGQDFLPLTIDFEERMYAIGKIPGSFFRREGRPGTEATLAARMTDRPIRPLFPKGFRREVQVVCTLLATDRENPGDALATIGASTVINLSPLPFEGPVSSVRISRTGGRFKAFPTYEEIAQSDLELTVAATNESVVMIEAGARQIPENELIEAIEYAEGICRQLNDLQAEVIAALGQPKMAFEAPQENTELKDRIRSLLEGREEEMLNAVKSEGFRGVDQMGAKVFRELAESLPPEQAAGLEQGAVRAATEALLKAFVRGRILTADMRADDRRPDDLRELMSQVSVLPRVHGSGLFQRGETQVLAVATLGPIGDRQRLDNISPEQWKRFMLHYNFPPFSVGEARFLRGPGRREIGHGMLGEKALAAVLPPFEEFPYTIRLVADVLSSNGSTSQASICASTLALMDAGVPILAPVAGIAMGLITNEDASDYRILTDIAGIEDGFGDMDFKVAGTETGVTAVQLDIKLKRLPDNFLAEVFRRAREARLAILDSMLGAISEPRDEVAEFAPKIIVVKIDPEKIGAIIGPGGRVINAIIGRTGAAIDVEPDGTVFVSGADHEGVRRAVGEIEGLTKEVKIGDVYEGPVTRLMAFGAFVEILPGKDGLVHISEMAEGRVERVEDVVNVGDRVKVKVVEIDNLGRINLSMRAMLGEGDAVGLSERELQGEDAPPRRDSGDDRGPRDRAPRGGDRGDRGGRGGDRGPRGGGGGGGGGRSGGQRFGSGGGYGGDRAPSPDAGPQRSERPAGGERPEAGARPSGGDRPAVNERASEGDGPSGGDRPAASERASEGERPSAGEPPAGGSDGGGSRGSGRRW